MRPTNTQASIIINALRILLCGALLLPPASAQQASRQATGTVIRVYSELVLTNVVVRDKSGNYVRGLKPENFSILEENKPQQIASFDFEDVDTAAPAPGPEQATVMGTRPQPTAAPSPAQDIASLLKNHRLVVLFFDLSSMQPDEIDRGVTAAEKYVDQQMLPADLVGVVSLSSSFQVNLDFTADRAQLRRVLASFNAGSGQGFEEGAAGDTEGTPDTAQPFTPDETEYNIFNSDRRLEALRSLAAMLSGVEQKKSVIYISSGMTRTGIENQSELRAAINAAVRANLSIYTLDVRGLQALVPGGNAQQASLRGVAPYSGAAVRNSLDSNFSSQETLVTLAADTGGRAFLDTNDFSVVFRGVQQDTATYYVLGYQSSNPARDGRFRRITVQVNVPGLKLDYRRGYYAPRDFQHFNQEDRESQLDEELASELPSTDLRVYLATAYFRLRGDKVFSAVSLLVPSSEVPFIRSNDQDRASLDVLGVVQDEQKRVVGRIRETIKLAVPESQEVRRKNVQYDTAFVLTPGKYHLKFVLRENQTGKLGSFQTDLAVPDFKAAPVKESSIVLAGQTQPAPKRQGENPLTRDGTELIPNVTHVFSRKQHLYLYYEVYDPARDGSSTGGEGGKAGGGEPGIHLLTNVLFFNGKVKAYETPLVEARSLNVPDRHAAVFQLDVPLAQLRPGFYTCQVNVIDDAAGRFVFRRLPLTLIQ